MHLSFPALFKAVRAVAIAALLMVGVDVLAQPPTVTVQAEGRGNPYFHFRDGQEMHLSYRGEQTLTAALSSGQAQPRSLAAIDLDRDGTPDVVAGYAYNGAGLVTIQRGNPDAFAPKDQSVFARLQQEGLVLVELKVVSLDSTSAKVHPDGTGAESSRRGRFSASRRFQS